MSKVSALTAATSIADDDLVYISDESGGNYTSKKITVQAFLGSSVGLLSATAGTVTASKAVIVDANKDAGDFRNLDATNIDAGLSGTAGSVDVFPSTASCGKLSLTSVNASGNYNTVVTTATAMGQSSTVTIPDPGAATASFVLTAAAQTVGGVKTFSSAPVVSVGDAGTNAVLDVLTVGHTTSATATTGFGTGISIKAEDASGNDQEVASIDAVFTTATHGSEDVDLVLNTMQNGTMAPALTLDASGQTVQVGQNSTDADNFSSVTIFPVTASRGSLVLSATAHASADRATTITNATDSGAAVTLTLPNATSTLSGLGLAETFSGVKTFSAAPLVTIDDATDNAVVDVITLTHSTSAGTFGDAGIGTGISIKSEDASGNVQEIASIDASLSTATHGSEDGDVIISTIQNAVVAPALTIDSSDQSVTIGQNATDVDNIDKLRIYGQTASKGSLIVKSVANTGDFDVTVQNAAHGQATVLTVPDIGQATGNVVLLKAAQTTAGTLVRADLTEEALSLGYRIPINQMMAADGAALAISETAGDHFLNLGTNTINLKGNTANAGSTASQTDVSYAQFILPPEYVAGGDVTVRVRCKIDGAGTDNASSIDLSAYEQADMAVGSDICTTGAQTFAAKSTWYSKDFTVTGTGLTAGDVLNLKITSVTTESASSDLIFYAEPVAVLLDIKG